MPMREEELGAAKHPKLKDQDENEKPLVVPKSGKAEKKAKDFVNFEFARSLRA
jgi:hypothetical protein